MLNLEPSVILLEISFGEILLKGVAVPGTIHIFFFFSDITPSSGQGLEINQSTSRWIIHHIFKARVRRVTEENEHLLSAYSMS